MTVLPTAAAPTREVIDLDLVPTTRTTFYDPIRQTTRPVAHISTDIVRHGPARTSLPWYGSGASHSGISSHGLSGASAYNSSNSIDNNINNSSGSVTGSSRTQARRRELEFLRPDMDYSWATEGYSPTYLSDEFSESARNGVEYVRDNDDDNEPLFLAELFDPEGDQGAGGGRSGDDDMFWFSAPNSDNNNPNTRAQGTPRNQRNTAQQHSMEIARMRFLVRRQMNRQNRFLLRESFVQDQLLRPNFHPRAGLAATARGGEAWKRENS